MFFTLCCVLGMVGGAVGFWKFTVTNRASQCLVPMLCGMMPIVLPIVTVSAINLITNAASSLIDEPTHSDIPMTTVDALISGPLGWILFGLGALGVASSALSRPRYDYASPVTAPSRRQIESTSSAAEPTPAPPSAEEIAKRRAVATSKIDTVKATYGELLCDVIALVEWHALFDSKVPTTSAFEAEMIALQDMNLDTAPLADVEAHAAKLDSTWNKALSYAKGLGLDGLTSDKKLATRAQSLAHTAARTTSSGERAAALEKLRLVFAALDVVLPKQAAKALEGGARQALDAA